MYGFTLVELLVVIAMIVLLAGIIYAAFGPAREKSRQVVCTSNLKQIYQALQTYRQDYSGSDAPGRYCDMGLPPNDVVLAQYMGWKGRDPLDIPKIWDCPALPSERRGKGAWGYSYQICDDGKDRRVRRCNPSKLPPGISLPKSLPTFAELMKKRGDNYPIVFDPWHDFARNPLVDPRFVIILRFGGQIQGRYVPRMSSSVDW
jgi:prepilin-type N-terminal cleavage/methylation domain-containing protein